MAITGRSRKPLAPKRYKGLNPFLSAFAFAVAKLSGVTKSAEASRRRASPAIALARAKAGYPSEVLTRFCGGCHGATADKVRHRLAKVSLAALKNISFLPVYINVQSLKSRIRKEFQKI